MVPQCEPYTLSVANIFRVVAGRLLEVRLDTSVRTAEDVDLWFDGVAAASTVVPPTKRLVVVADWRACPLLSNSAADKALERLRKVNPRVERSAALAGRNSAVTVLQFLRLCRDSNHPNRRLFTDPTQMVEWLSEALTLEEQIRLNEFVLEHESGEVDNAQWRQTGA